MKINANRRPVVLFVCYGGGHAALLSPVVAQMAERGKVDVVALALTTACTTFKSRGLKYKAYADYVCGPESDAVLELGNRLCQDVNSESVGVPRSESVAYMGSCMRELIVELGETAAWDRYEREGRHSFLPVSTLKKIIGIENADLVVATNSPKSERAAIIAARQLGVESMIIPDLFANPQSSYVPFEAEWYAVMSTATKEDLVQFHKVDPSRVEVTGQPALDKSNAPSEMQGRRYAEELLNLPPGRKYVLLVTSTDLNNGVQTRPSSERSRRSVNQIASFAREFKHFDFVIKPHPTEPRSTYEGGIAGIPNMRLTPPDSKLDSLAVAASGVIATSLTTAALDAYCLGKPVLLIDETGSESFRRVGIDCIDRVEDVESGVKAFLQLLEATAKNGPTAFVLQNRRAAHRVCNFIERVLYRKDIPVRSEFAVVGR